MLVAIGAASCVVFEGLFPDDGSPTRVAAQVVSGIGFLGAGIIFRERLQVTGLKPIAIVVGLQHGSEKPGIANKCRAF
jgi:putative Mg2+ transporter-C (MgtC) family protein